MYSVSKEVARQSTRSIHSRAKPSKTDPSLSSLLLKLGQAPRRFLSPAPRSQGAPSPPRPERPSEVQTAAAPSLGAGIGVPEAAEVLGLEQVDCAADGKSGDRIMAAAGSIVARSTRAPLEPAPAPLHAQILHERQTQSSVHSTPRSAGANSVIRPTTKLADPSRIATTSPWRPHRRMRGKTWMNSTEMSTVNGGCARSWPRGWRKGI
jgi:hypothetical protein